MWLRVAARSPAASLWRSRHAWAVVVLLTAARDLEPTPEREAFEKVWTEANYAAMTELCRRPLVYLAIILSLAAGETQRVPLVLVDLPGRHLADAQLWHGRRQGRARRDPRLADAVGVTPVPT